MWYDPSLFPGKSPPAMWHPLIKLPAFPAFLSFSVLYSQFQPHPKMHASISVFQFIKCEKLGALLGFQLHMLKKLLAKVGLTSCVFFRQGLQSFTFCHSMPENIATYILFTFIICAERESLVMFTLSCSYFFESCSVFQMTKKFVFTIEKIQGHQNSSYHLP